MDSLRSLWRAMLATLQLASFFLNTCVWALKTPASIKERLGHVTEARASWSDISEFQVRLGYWLAPTVPFWIGQAWFVPLVRRVKHCYYICPTFCPP